MFVSVILQMAIAWVYSHLLEYCLHRWWLHNRKRKHWFKDHFGNHHKLARKNWMYDYRSHHPISPTKDREIKGLALLALLHSPVAFWFPWAYLVLVYSAVAYFLVHRRAHQDFRWARENLPWHYDHHVGPNQHLNWGVRLPWVDWVVGTREVYKGTPREEKQYNSFLRTIKRIYAVRSRRNKCKERQESSQVVREQPWSHD